MVEQHGDLKKAEHAIGTGPFLLERYEPNVKTTFKRNPDYFRQGEPWIDGVEWLVLDDPSTGLAMYRTGQIDCGPAAWWAVRQEDLEAVKKSHPQLAYQDFLSNVTHGIYMRTDMPPLNDVRIRRAILTPLTGRRWLMPCMAKGQPTRRPPVACPSGLQPSTSSALGRHTINTIRRRPGVCWQRLVFLGV